MYMELVYNGEGNVYDFIRESLMPSLTGMDTEHEYLCTCSEDIIQDFYNGMMEHIERFGWVVDGPSPGLTLPLVVRMPTQSILTFNADDTLGNRIVIKELVIS